MTLLENKLPEDKWFYFRNGKRASSIQELKDILEEMDEFEFKHHVNNERNDFANWIEGVFQEKKLAKSLREVSERDGMIIILEEFLDKKHPEVEAEQESVSEGKSEEEETEEKEEAAELGSRVIIPPDKKLGLDSEKDLSEHEIKNMVAEAKQVLDKQIERQHKGKVFVESREAKAPEHHKFVVAEFIYGFVLGLIFGLIMLGILFNLRFT